MIEAAAEVGPGEFRLLITGHDAGDQASCAAVTALEQTTMIMLEQLAAMRPDEVHFELRALEATS